MIELVAKTAAACIGNCIVRRLSTLIAALFPWHKRTYEGVAGFLRVKQSFRLHFSEASYKTGVHPEKKELRRRSGERDRERTRRRKVAY